MHVGRANRRTFLAGLGAAAWLLVARGQQATVVRRVGSFTGLAENDPEGRQRVAAFLQQMTELGWAENRNLGTWVGPTFLHLSSS